MVKELPLIPEVIRNKWPDLTFVKVAEIKMDKPMYCVDYIENQGWRLLYSTGFVERLLNGETN